jgi:hypothetical protein
MMHLEDWPVESDGVKCRSLRRLRRKTSHFVAAIDNVFELHLAAAESIENRASSGRLRGPKRTLVLCDARQAQHVTIASACTESDVGGE